jgi:hypothetical protein
MNIQLVRLYALLVTDVLLPGNEEVCRACVAVAARCRRRKRSGVRVVVAGLALVGHVVGRPAVVPALCRTLLMRSADLAGVVLGWIAVGGCHVCCIAAEMSR